MVAVGVLLLALLQPASVPATPPSADARLQLGFNRMYALRFAEADAIFADWQAAHPDDPRGPVAEAAGLIFAEFNRLGVLEAEFYAEDARFTARRKISPDPATRAKFKQCLARAESLAQRRLDHNPRDRDALFAMTLANGLEGDYLALVEKDNLGALRHTHEAALWAEKLLAGDPTYYDAYLATGISQYIVGSLFAPLRWLLRLRGYSGNRKDGIRNLKLAAEHGRLLAPFARLLLAIADLRAGDQAGARRLLVGLRDDFPTNPLFAKEIARLDRSGG
jgi:hypothetical protein